GLLRLAPSCRLALEAREAFDEPRRRAVLDRRPRALDAFARIAHLPGDLERERGAERERGPRRGRIFSCERRFEPFRVLRGIAADERFGCARLDAVIGRVADLSLHVAGTDVEADEGAYRRRLVPALRAVDHERTLDLHARQGFGHELGHRLAERA